MDKKEVRREIQRIKRQNGIVFAVFIAMAAIAAICFGVYRYQHAFTVRKWHADVENRTRIVGDLLETYQLIGMHESDVTALLGKEDSERSSFKISRETFPPESTLVYDLGIGLIDNEWLVISLNDGVVCAYCIDVS